MGSPAIDAGVRSAAPKTDQRGLLRPFGAAVDIGAYEVVPLLRTSFSPGGGLDLLGFGLAYPTCQLLTSSNLLDWLPTATNQVSPDGTTLFHESGISVSEVPAAFIDHPFPDCVRARFVLVPPHASRA